MRSFDASTSTDLEPVAMVLSDLHDRAVARHVEMMVVGAAARDILIRHVTGTPPDRATADVDIAVAVSSWEDVERLTGPFEGRRGVPHRFVVRAVEVDIIPFGGIESADRTITWPNDHVMSVFGFAEAMSSVVRVTLPGGAVVAVASLPAQSLLKLVAWRDRRHRNRRDAIDLRTVLRAYHEGPYFEELYAGHEDLLARHDFDPELAGAERLGCEARALIATPDRALVTDLLECETTFESLAADMGGRVDGNRALLSAYRGGLTRCPG